MQCAGISCHRAFVSLSLHLSEVGVLLKWLNLGSLRITQTMMPKTSAKLKWGHTNEGAKCRREKVKCRWDSCILATLSASVDNLARSQIYHAGAFTCMFVGCSASCGLSATADTCAVCNDCVLPGCSSYSLPASLDVAVHATSGREC